MAVPSNKSVTVSQINIATQKVTVEAQYNALIAGINAELTDAKFVLNGQTYTKAQLIAQLQSVVDSAETTKTNRATLTSSVAQERALLAAVAPLRMGVKQLLQSRYGKGSAELQKFGFTPAKVPQRPVAGKASGIEKNLATRAARNTMGKKAKLQITGTPPPTPASPPAPPPAPAPPAAPAAPAAPATPPAAK